MMRRGDDVAGVESGPFWAERESALKGRLAAAAAVTLWIRKERREKPPDEGVMRRVDER
jgi:hypothetical protein